MAIEYSDDNGFITLLISISDSDDVLAFSRKWDTKPTVIVVSNLSINNRTVSITSPNTEQNKATVSSGYPKSLLHF